MSGDGWTWTWRRSGPVGRTCPGCLTIHGSDAVAAVGRFDPSGVHGYVARAGGPLRVTRVQAHADVCAARRAS